ncbi:MAG TPA: PAS domain S-box protein [Aestuariivirga sp.]|nr:PAS domain S-box protein [Aestuariivirga sp.]
MTLDDRLIRNAPVLFDLVSQHGWIVYANATEEQELGYRKGNLSSVSFELLYPPESRELIASVLEGRVASPVRLAHMQVRRADRQLVTVAANIDVVDDDTHGPCARLMKFPVDDTLREVERLRRENDVLSSIVSTARDASYCIDFIEPVDLTAPEHEIIRQVFENRCCWRYCNEAMARLYKLPMGDDLNSRDVREVFARNPENEDFVRTLIENRWTVDGALSRDLRYDGAGIYIENDVRADIRQDQLHRFWGVVRELSARRMQERELEDQASAALDILAAVADPILVTDRDGLIVGANPAAEWALGWPLDSLLDRGLGDVLRLRADILDVIRKARPGRLAERVDAKAVCRDGRTLACIGLVSAVLRDGQPPRAVVTLRMEPPALSLERAS